MATLMTITASPASGAVLDYSKGKVTFQWTIDNPYKAKLISWWIVLGTQDGAWDILMCGTEKAKMELDVHRLPIGGYLYAQVTAKYNGETTTGQPMEEEILSHVERWVCPATDAPCCV